MVNYILLRSGILSSFLNIFNHFCYKNALSSFRLWSVTMGLSEARVLLSNEEQKPSLVNILNRLNALYDGKILIVKLVVLYRKLY